MKTTIIIVIIIVLVVAGFYFFGDELRHGGSMSEAGMVTGTITRIDLDAVAFDGPARIVVATDSGGEEVIAVPSMGLPLCAARENIADPFSLEVGQQVSANGEENPQGDIVPCSSEEHYLRVI